MQWGPGHYWCRSFILKVVWAMPERIFFSFPFTFPIERNNFLYQHSPLYFFVSFAICVVQNVSGTHALCLDSHMFSFIVSPLQRNIFQFVVNCYCLLSSAVFCCYCSPSSNEHALNSHVCPNMYQENFG